MGRGLLPVPTFRFNEVLRIRDVAGGDGHEYVHLETGTVLIRVSLSRTEGTSMTLLPDGGVSGIIEQQSRTTWSTERVVMLLRKLLTMLNISIAEKLGVDFECFVVSSDNMVFERYNSRGALLLHRTDMNARGVTVQPHREDMEEAMRAFFQAAAERPELSVSWLTAFSVWMNPFEIRVSGDRNEKLEVVCGDYVILRAVLQKKKRVADFEVLPDRSARQISQIPHSDWHHLNNSLIYVLKGLGGYALTGGCKGFIVSSTRQVVSLVDSPRKFSVSTKDHLVVNLQNAAKLLLSSKDPLSEKAPEKAPELRARAMETEASVPAAALEKMRRAVRSLIHKPAFLAKLAVIAFMGRESDDAFQRTLAYRALAPHLDRRSRELLKRIMCLCMCHCVFVTDAEATELGDVDALKASAEALIAAAMTSVPESLVPLVSALVYNTSLCDLQMTKEVVEAVNGLCAFLCGGPVSNDEVGAAFLEISTNS